MFNRLSIWFVKLYIFVLPLQFLYIYKLNELGSGFRLYHLVGFVATSLILLGAFINAAQQKLIYKFSPDWLIVFYMLFAVGFCVFNSEISNPSIIMPIFALCGYLIGFFSMTNSAAIDLQKQINRMCTTFFIVVLIKNIYYSSNLAATIFNGQEELRSILWIVSGGPNIESTILSIMLVLQNSGFYSIKVFFVLSTAFFYQSRTGFLLWTIVIFRNLYIKNIVFLLLVIIVIAVLLLILVQTDFSFLQRFLKVGDEIESETGRSLLWRQAFHLFTLNSYGYGIGNGFALMLENIGLELQENNFHNIYIQSFVDNGVVGGLCLLYISIQRVIRSFFFDHSRYAFATLLLFLTGLIQWTGYDPFFWFVVGLSDAKFRVANNYFQV